MPLEDVLNKLQMLLIELNYALADVAHEVDNLRRFSSNEYPTLRQHADFLDASTHTLIDVTRALRPH